MADIEKKKKCPVSPTYHTRNLCMPAAKAQAKLWGAGLTKLRLLAGAIIVKILCSGHLFLFFADGTTVFTFLKTRLIKECLYHHINYCKYKPDVTSLKLIRSLHYTLKIDLHVLIIVHALRNL